MKLGFEESTLCPNCYHVWVVDCENRNWIGTMLWRPFSRVHEFSRGVDDWRVTAVAVDAAFKRFMEAIND